MDHTTISRTVRLRPSRIVGSPAQIDGDIGDVNWVSEANATQSQLAYVNDAGRVIIKVDNTSFVPWNEKRDTVSPPTVIQ